MRVGAGVSQGRPRVVSDLRWITLTDKDNFILSVVKHLKVVNVIGGIEVVSSHKRTETVQIS